LPTRDTTLALPSVLCPWVCSEFCFLAKPYKLAIAIQHYLTNVQLMAIGTNELRPFEEVRARRFAESGNRPYTICFENLTSSFFLIKLNTLIFLEQHKELCNGIMVGSIIAYKRYHIGTSCNLYCVHGSVQSFVF